METAIEELQRRHPNVDRMMCETLLKLHDQGKLDKHMPKLDEKPPQPEVCILRGAITIENNFSAVILRGNSLPVVVNEPDGAGNNVPHDLP